MARECNFEHFLVASHTTPKASMMSITVWALVQYTRIVQCTLVSSRVSGMSTARNAPALHPVWGCEETDRTILNNLYNTVLFTIPFLLQLIWFCRPKNTRSYKTHKKFNLIYDYKKTNKRKLYCIVRETEARSRPTILIKQYPEDVSQNKIG